MRVFTFKYSLSEHLNQHCSTGGRVYSVRILLSRSTSLYIQWTARPGNPATGLGFSLFNILVPTIRCYEPCRSILGARPSFNFLQHVVPEAERHAPLCGGHPNPSNASTPDASTSDTLAQTHTSSPWTQLTHPRTNGRDVLQCLSISILEEYHG